MEKYINMNDSFGGKNSDSSTKSFQTSYEQCIESLKQQVLNHKKALTMAQKLLQHYKQQNQRLSQQNQRLSQEVEKQKEGKDRAQQKYEVLQKLFLKFDRQKEKEIKKQARRSQQKYLLQVQTINTRYQGYLATLNQRVYLLEGQLRKYKDKQRQWQQFQATVQKQIKKEYVHLSRKSRQKIKDDVDNLNSKNMKLAKQQKFDKYQHFDSMDKMQNKQRDQQKSRAKQASFSSGTKEAFDRAGLVKKDSSLTNKDKKVFKTIQFMRLSTEDDYHSNKEDILRTVQKNPRMPVTYDNFFTEYKNYK